MLILQSGVYSSTYNSFFTLQTSTTKYMDSTSDFLLSAKVDIFSHDYCMKTSRYNCDDIDDETQFCAGTEDGSKDACQGIY